MSKLPKYVNLIPTKRVIGGEDYYLHTVHPTKKAADDIESWLALNHPKKYIGKTKIIQDPDGRWKLWAKKWW